MNDACPSHLLSDEPSSRDALGGHLGTAKSLARTVSEEDGGRAIAIIGRYGAGKSTVLRLFDHELTKELQSSHREARVFIFDAWAHQGDPLRRTFLEELHSFLTLKRWISESAFSKELKELAERSQSSITTSTPQLTPQGNAVAASLFLVPLGAGLISRGEYFAGLIASMAPVLVAVFFWGLHLLAPNFVGSDDLPTVEFLWRKTRDTSVSTSVSSREPTSVEFRALFSKIVGAALRQTTRRLVIVMDNLDRLDPAEAMQIFATMRTFFENRSAEQWDNRLWLVVPFDPGWTMRLTASGDPADPDRSASFLDKSFQVQLEVAAPTLSSWKHFLIDCLRTALPRHADDFDKVYLTYREAVPLRGSRLSPRAIKQFVNQLVTLHRQWGDDIPLPTQATYLLFKDELRAAAHGLPTVPAVPDAVRRLLNDPALDSDLGALHYSVPRDMAAHVLLGDAVRDALTTGNDERLEELSKMPGFSDVVEGAIVDDRYAWANEAPQSMALAAYGLASSLPTAVPLLVPAARTVKHWRLNGAESGKGLAAIVAATPEIERGAMLLQVLERLPIPNPPTSGTIPESQLSEWLLPVVEVLKWGSADYESLIREHYRVSARPEDYIALIDSSVMLEVAPTIRSLLIPAGSPTDVVGALAAELGSPTLLADPEALIRGFSDVAIDWPFQPLVSRLAGELGAMSDLAPSRVTSGIVSLFELGYEASNGPAIEALRKAAASGALLHHLWKANMATPLSAITLFVMMTGDAEPSQTPGDAATAINALNKIRQDPDQSPDVLRQLTNLVSRYASPVDILQRAAASPVNRKLVGIVFAGLAHQSARARDYSRALVRGYDTLREVLAPDQLRNVVESTAAHGYLVEEAIGHGFDPKLAALYELALGASGGEHVSMLVRFISNGLREEAVAAWTAELTAPGPRIALIRVIVHAGHRGFLGVALEDAMRDYSRAILGGAAVPDAIRSNWAVLLDALESSAARTLYRDVWRDILQAPEGATVAVMELYGAPLIASDGATERADEIVRVLCRSLLASKQTSEIRFVQDLIGSGDGLLKSAPESSIRNLYDRGRALLRDETLGADVQAALEAVVSSLKSVLRTPADDEAPRSDESAEDEG